MMATELAIASCGPSGSLRCMATGDRTVGRVHDPDGREVVLLARIWDEKISRDHPELPAHLDGVLATAAKPDHVEADAVADRKRFYRRGLGPQPLAAGGRKLRAGAGSNHQRAGEPQGPNQWKL